jgi:hypothetical protein
MPVPYATPTAFDGIPPLVEQLTLAGERVLVVLLDALGMRFVERHAAHPLLARLDAVHPVASQFPSTTTAHVTTMHTGLPVGQHGLYEWNVLEPALGRIITPLRCSFAGDRESDTLPAGFDVAELLPPGPTLYEQLAAAGVPSAVFQPSSFSPSTFDGEAVRGADLRPYFDLREAVEQAAAALGAAPAETGAYAYVYSDAIDAAGHMHGPSSPEFDAAITATLDAVSRGLQDARAITVLFTADHGQVDVDGTDMLWLDDVHPPLRELELRAAGSARDVFLHVPEAGVDAAIAALSVVAEAHRTADLLAAGAFGAAGPRLEARLASVCVLPPPGQMAWVRSARDLQPRFRGHHGGRTPDETRTWLGELRL